MVFTRVKRSALVVLLVVLLTGGAGALAEATGDLLPQNAASSAMLPQGELLLPASTYRVSFLDIDGEEIGWVDIDAGHILFELAGYPEVEGLQFLYWYEGLNEAGEAIPFQFGLPVDRDIALFPYYEAYQENIEYSVQTPMTVEAVDQLIHGILDDGATLLAPSGEGVPPVEALPEVSMQPDAILSTEHAQPEADVQAPDASNILTDSTQPVHDDTALPGAKADQAVADDTSAGDGSLQGDETPAADAGDLLLPVVAETNADETEPAAEPVTDLPADDAASVADPTADGLLPPEADGLFPTDPTLYDGDETLFVPPTLSGGRMVLVTCAFEGDAIREGTEVTLRAELINFPADGEIHYQWQNDLTGAFADVPGATGQSFSFVSDGENTKCSWQVRTLLTDAD